MKTLRFLGVALVAMMVVAGFTACSSDDDDTSEIYENEEYDVVVDGLAYKITSVDDLTAAVTWKTNPSTYSGAISIPSSVTINGREFSVTSIGGGAFEESSITSVTIPNTVTHILDYAFSECEKLKKINIPNTVTYIGRYAFMKSGLESITIPASVESIREKSFAVCNDLKSVTIEDCDEKWNCYEYPYDCASPFDSSPVENLYIGRNISGSGLGVGSFNSTEYDGDTWDSALKAVTFGSRVTDARNINVEMSNVTSITFKGTTPPKYYADSFSNDCLMTTVLYVPASAMETYKADECWGRFWNIEAVN